jgi:hypothetical protein
MGSIERNLSGGFDIRGSSGWLGMAKPNAHGGYDLFDSGGFFGSLR